MVVGYEASEISLSVAGEWLEDSQSVWGKRLVREW